MGTQSYRPWGERLLSKHKLFLSQEGPAFSIATPSQILFSLFKRLPRLHVWCSKTVACGLLVAGLPGKISWPIIKSQLYHLHATFWFKRRKPKVFSCHCFAVGKLNSLFCTCIFIMSTEELEAFSYHQHSFLTEAGRQATPAWWLSCQSHREVNFAKRFQENFAKKC